MQWRFTLGKKEDSTNVIQNGNFSGGSTNWTLTNFTIVGGKAENPANGTIGRIVSTGYNAFDLGEDYVMRFEMDDTLIALVKMNACVGDYCRDIIEESGTGGFNPVTVEVTRRAISGRDVLIKVAGQASNIVTIDNIEAYKMIWNNPLTNQPIIKEAKLGLERDDEHFGIDIKHIFNLNFWGDGYDFLLNEYQTFGACNEVPVKVENRCSPNDDWVELDNFEGVIYLADIDFDYHKCEAKVDVLNRNYQTMLNARNVKVFLPTGADGSYFRELPDPTPTNLQNVDFFDNTGAYTGSRTVFAVGISFREIIVYSSNMFLEFKSDLFDTDLPYFSFLMGFDLRTSTSWNFPNSINISFKDFFEEFSKVFSLGWRIVKENNVYKVVVDRRNRMFSSSIIAILDNVGRMADDGKFPTLSFNLSSLPKTIKVGYKDKWDTDSQEDYTFYTDSKCASDDEKNYLSSYVQDSEAIFNIFANAANADKFDDKVILVEVEDDGGNFQAIQFPGILYNGSIDYDDNMDSHARTLPLVYYQDVDNTGVRPSTTGLKVLGTELWELEAPLDDTDITTIFANPLGIIRFNSPENNIPDTDCYIMKMELSLLNNLAKFELIQKA